MRAALSAAALFPSLFFSFLLSVFYSLSITLSTWILYNIYQIYYRLLPGSYSFSKHFFAALFCIFALWHDVMSLLRVPPLPLPLTPAHTHTVTVVSDTVVLLLLLLLPAAHASLSDGFRCCCKCRTLPLLRLPIYSCFLFAACRLTISE